MKQVKGEMVARTPGSEFSPQPLSRVAFRDDGRLAACRLAWAFDCSGPLGFARGGSRKAYYVGQVR